MATPSNRSVAHDVQFENVDNVNEVFDALKTVACKGNPQCQQVSSYCNQHLASVYVSTMWFAAIL